MRIRGLETAAIQSGEPPRRRAARIASKGADKAARVDQEDEWKPAEVEEAVRRDMREQFWSCHG